VPYGVPVARAVTGGSRQFSAEPAGGQARAVGDLVEARRRASCGRPGSCPAGACWPGRAGIRRLAVSGDTAEAVQPMGCRCAFRACHRNGRASVRELSGRSRDVRRPAGMSLSSWGFVYRCCPLLTGGCSSSAGQPRATPGWPPAQQRPFQPAASLSPPLSVCASAHLFARHRGTI
jgi:hypothetical protein